MFFQYGTDSNEKQTAEEESQFWVEQLETYLAPYSQRLDAYLDRRVVGNLTATVAGIVQTRSPLTTSELGSVICGPEHAEAGTQRLQRAFHHQGWKSERIEEVLWEQAEKSRKEMEQQGETPLCIWDSSVLEKPESLKLEGLGSVRSSRVRRLARSRPGVFNRPGIPVSVRGFEWESLGDCARQTALGRGATALGYPFPCLSQHAGAREAFAPPRVSWPLVVGRGPTRQRARTLVSAHQ